MKFLKPFNIYESISNFDYEEIIELFKSNVSDNLPFIKLKYHGPYNKFRNDKEYLNSEDYFLYYATRQYKDEVYIDMCGNNNDDKCDEYLNILIQKLESLGYKIDLFKSEIDPKVYWTRILQIKINFSY